MHNVIRHTQPYPAGAKHPARVTVLRERNASYNPGNNGVNKRHGKEKRWGICIAKVSAKNIQQKIIKRTGITPPIVKVRTTAKVLMIPAQQRTSNKTPMACPHYNRAGCLPFLAVKYPVFSHWQPASPGYLFSAVVRTAPGLCLWFQIPIFFCTFCQSRFTSTVSPRIYFLV